MPKRRVKVIHPSSAFTALLLTLPMAVVMAIVVFDIQPIETFLESIFTQKENMQNTLVGLAFLAIIGFALPIALVINLWPMLKKASDGKHRYYIINLLLAAAIIGIMSPTFGGMAKDIYKCDILELQNCD